MLSERIVLSCVKICDSISGLNDAAAVSLLTCSNESIPIISSRVFLVWLLLNSDMSLRSKSNPANGITPFRCV